MDYDTLIKVLRKILVIASVDDPILPVTSIQASRIIHCYPQEFELVQGIRFPIGKIDIVLAKIKGVYDEIKYGIFVMGDDILLYNERVKYSENNLAELLFEKREKIVDAMLKDFLEN